MTDQEMIELAAKAAGWAAWRNKHGYWNLTSPGGRQYTACDYRGKFEWTGEKLPEPTLADALKEIGFNPLESDANAFALAVKLRMCIVVKTTPHFVYVEVYNGAANSTIEVLADVRLKDQPDSLAATRRAITHFAAKYAARTMK